MKVYLESVDEGGRALTLLGQLDNEVYSVAREAAITPTHILPLRLELSRSPLPWVARAALKERRQHVVESVVDFQRHLRILAKQAYPEDSCAALENRILENFVDGIVNPDIRRQTINKFSSSGNQLPKPAKLTMYDDNDHWEGRMKVYLESVNEGSRSLAILGQLDSEVYAVARAANITSSLTTATVFDRLRWEFGRSPMPWVARATLREHRQHSGESVVDFQRHLRVLAQQAYSEDTCDALEDRVLDNFVDGVANPDIRRQFMQDPPKTLKAALDIARDE
ncbi:hypothetical protein SprV_0301349500 [Sparganum proliferum]